MREGVILFIEDDYDRIAMQLRDGGGFKGMWGLFGGWMEAGENHTEAAMREMAEELSLTLQAGQLQYLGASVVQELDATSHFFHYRISDDEIRTIILREGADWGMMTADNISHLNVASVYVDYLNWFKTHRPI